MTKTGNFFEHAPSAFTLAPGASQIVVITGLPVAEGDYSGSSTPTGIGVPSELSISVRLVSAEGSSGTFVRGREILVDLTSGKRFSEMSAVAGPLVTFDCSIPCNVSINGFPTSTQGFILTANGFILCNALEVSFGGF